MSLSSTQADLDPISWEVSQSLGLVMPSALASGTISRNGWGTAPGLDPIPGGSARDTGVVCKVLVRLVNVHIHLASVRSNLPPDACRHLSGSTLCHTESPGHSIVVWEGASLSGHPSSLDSPSKLPSFRHQHCMVIPSRLDAVPGPKPLRGLSRHSLPSGDWSGKNRAQSERHFAGFLRGIALCPFYPPKAGRVAWRWQEFTSAAQPA